MLEDFTHLSPPGYRAFFSTPISGQGHHGGTTIFICSDVPLVPQQLDILLQAVAVKVFLGRFYTLYSFYLPPSIPVVRPNLDSLAHVLPSPFLLLGDYNSCHPLWDGGAFNPCGVLIASLIEDEGLKLLNTGDVTHFHSQTGTFTSIDFSVCSSNSLLDFTWRVLPDLYGSDHFPILLESVDSEPRSRPPPWYLDRSNWQCFTDPTSSVHPLADFGTCNNATAYITDVLHSADLQSIPKTSDLQFGMHIAEKAKKANTILGLIKKSFICIDEDMFRCLYTALIRPHLKYVSCVWSPHKLGERKLIEGVYRRAKKLISSISEQPYNHRLRHLGLPTLEFRRHRADMLQVYKLLLGYINLFYSKFN